ncbi:MAG: hypothetical protein EKK64_08785 [Neisseriaceae bacterium]|jgi:hypothetical protein|nr:MAG: hypothetical protein EKK64_08785 [Neisseriaceae bacterium]
MFKKICGAIFAIGLTTIAVADNGVHDMYATNPELNNIVESGNNPSAVLGFKTGWYGHKKDVTYIKLISVGTDIGLSVLFNTRGLVCPIDEYLLFKQSTATPNKFNYNVGNGCIATITMGKNQESFVMTVNSRSTCFEEYSYQQFCNGNLDLEYMNERKSRNFIGVPFIYQKDQNDDDYDYNDD